ncbi:MAG: MotA/TolQ/ExbB proton channel family protein [Pirellulales bacterium]|nr:MotA/TolQ/ExbB proton channel family protein [Pirellulales bacterium]
MDTNALAKFLADFCYVFLAANLLWGLYCAILVWRRLRQIRFAKPEDEREFLDTIRQELDAGNLEEAMDYCSNDERALPQLALLALENHDLDLVSLRQLMGERMQRDVIAPLENRVNWVLTVIRNGPLLGLFGTVLGMMAAFGRIGTGEKVDPSQIADEISVALICTAMGLGTAIPLGYVASSLTMRIRDLQESTGHALVRLLDRLKEVAV